MAGSGTYVEVPEDQVTYPGGGMIGGRNVLLDKYDQTFGLVGTMTEKVESVIEGFESILDSIASPDDVKSILGNVVISDVQSIGQMNITEPGTLNLPGFEDVVFPVAPALKPAPQISLDYNAPEEPADINPALNYTMTSYSSEMWEMVFRSVRDGVLVPGTGIDPDIEAGIWERDRLRREQENAEAYRKATADLGRRGFRFPQIALRSIEQRMANAIAKQNRESSLDIAIQQSNLAQKNREANMDRAVSLEQLVRDFWKTRESLSLEASKAAANLIVSTYAERVKAFLGKWEGIVSELRAKTEVIKTVAAENAVLIDGYKATMEGVVAKVDAVSAERKALVDAHKVEGDVYEAKVRAFSSWYSALTENQKAKLEQSRLSLEKALGEVKAVVDIDVSINSLKEKILESLGNMSSQVLASALNAVHTSIGHSTSVEKSRGESWKHSDSISESHSFDETAT